MYHSDIDIVLYIHIYMHTDARPSMPSHRYTLAYTFIHTRMREEMAAAKRTWSRRCACARAHLGIRTRLDARASIQTHVVQMGITHTPARAHAHVHVHADMDSICTHTHTYVLTHTHIYVSLVIARVRAAPDARSHAHTHTHIRADMYSIYALLHVHMGSDIPTYIYVHSGT